MGKFDKAEEVFEVLIKNSFEDDLEGLSRRYHLMGSVKQHKGDYKEALILYKKALNSYRFLSNSSQLDFTILYNDIGSTYRYKGEYSKSLKYHQMALDIQNRSNPLNYSDLVITYGNLAEFFFYYTRVKGQIKA
ncbi:unnamed protein product [Rotaria sp. Silwood2]|nr:unnamed protein product [Rotaria sp. Silwood2]CAF3112465.1 unnamed protein product [Rotaria sp. Silwood2]CAF3182449.1 unnamed protein product [Rotaria sp. Silwood2]CAF3413292.1 unnamed protein product [Rotaria sp. Silwood2]CAF4302320.1 unnamed protein product [Rotaria sp. Silwood2]